MPTTLRALAQLRIGPGELQSGSRKGSRAWAGCSLPGLPEVASANSSLSAGAMAAQGCTDLATFTWGRGARACGGSTSWKHSSLPRAP